MIIHLHIYSWRGVSFGAVHYYGELQSDVGAEYKVVELTHRLTQRQAAKLNKAADWPGLYKPGDDHKGFDTEEDVVKSALEVWQDHFSGGKYLVLGSHTYMEPKPLVAVASGDGADLKAKVQSIIDRCEKIGWYEKRANYDEMDRLTDEWNSLLV